MKKFVSVFAASWVAVSAMAEVESGSCGTGVSYSYDTETKVLTISGTGVIKNYSSKTAAPFSEDTETLIIEDGVTTVGRYAFTKCNQLKKIELPSTLEWVEVNSAFVISDNLESVVFNGTLKEWAAIDWGNMTNYFYSCWDKLSIDGKIYSNTDVLEIPEGVTKIGKAAFSGISVAAVEFPSTLETISEDAFYNAKIKSNYRHLPKSLKSIGQYAFAAVRGVFYLESLTPPAIGSNSFDQYYTVGFVVPSEAMDAYLEADVWKDQKDKIVNHELMVKPYDWIHGSVSVSGAVFDLYDSQADNTIYYFKTHDDAKVKMSSDWYSPDRVIVDDKTIFLDNTDEYTIKDITGDVVVEAIFSTKLTINDRGVGDGYYKLVYDRVLPYRDMTFSVEPVYGSVILSITCDGVELDVTKSSHTIKTGDKEPNLVVNAALSLEGTCGEGLNWKLDIKEGKLTINGNGKMEEYASKEDAPWAVCAEYVKNVYLTGDIKSVSDNAFAACENLEIVDVDSKSNVAIGKNTFKSGTAAKVEIHRENDFYENDENWKGLTKSYYYTATITTEELKNCKLKDYGSRPSCVAGGTMYVYAAVDEGYTIVVYANGKRTSKGYVYSNEYVNYKVSDVHSDIVFSAKAVLITEGTCGDDNSDVKWSYDEETKTMTISGEGSIKYFERVGDIYSDEMNTPWNVFVDDIETVVVKEGVTGLGQDAFYGSDNLKTVVLPSTCHDYGLQSFGWCPKLESVMIVTSAVMRNNDQNFSNYDNCTLYVPVDLVETIKKDIIFSKFSKIVGIYRIMADETVKNGKVKSDKYWYLPNEDGTISFEPDFGYELATVMIDGEVVEVKDNTCQVKNIEKDITINVEFKTDTSGTCGENLTWNYDESTRVLTISGTGAMDDYEPEKAPWSALVDKIFTVVVEEGVTKIGSNAFCDMYGTREFYFASSVEDFGMTPFSMVSHPMGYVVPYVYVSNTSILKNINSEVFAESSFDICLSVPGKYIEEFKNDEMLPKVHEIINLYAYYEVKVDESIANGKIYVENSQTIAIESTLVTFYVTPAFGYRVLEVTVNDEVVTPVNDVFRRYEVKANSDIVIKATFELIDAINDEYVDESIVYASGNVIVVKNASGPVAIYDLSGNCVASTKKKVDEAEFVMPKSGLYLVKTGKAVRGVLTK
ncbi:MAG: leucine-rich repeat domain-containing protein [Bacteroidales bacterium]|nr:leucine-rich repeat domain-containing protein [Bacteroidales bacterium]